MPACLINGIQSGQLDPTDRGLLYGDGVFRTMRVEGGQILCWPRHYLKLQHDCSALGLPCPSREMLLDEFMQLTLHQRSGVAKIIVTRGPQSGSGYVPGKHPDPTRILSIVPPPDYPQHFRTTGIQLHVCSLRLAHQPRLAGIKHLNRLENVLAAMEWSGTGCAEGLMLDESNHVIEGTRSNLFMVRKGTLLTPDLTRCGVAGVQRERIIEWANKAGIPCKTGNMTLADLADADEMFVVNSIIGVWPVHTLLDLVWTRFPISSLVQNGINHALD